MLKFRILKSDLRGVETQLKRLNQLLEAYLTASGVELPSSESKTPKIAQSEGLEVSYTDPELQYLQEIAARDGKRAKFLEELDSEPETEAQN